MKTVLRNLCIVALGVLLFSSCDDLGKTKLKFNTSFDVQLPVVVTPSKGDFLVSDTINILEHPDLIQYTNQITNIEITSVTVEVMSVNPTPLTLTNTNVSASVTDLPAALWVFNSQVFELGTVFDLDNSDGQFAKAKAVFLSQLPIAVNFSGHVDAPAATFTVKVTFNTEVTVTVGVL